MSPLWGFGLAVAMIAFAFILPKLSLPKKEEPMLADRMAKLDRYSFDEMMKKRSAYLRRIVEEDERGE
jgi:hypothetical protein